VGVSSRVAARATEGSPQLGYERASVLFNLGAYYSTHARNASLSTGEGLKTACNLYQVPGTA
jgi:hypothetical protein